MPNFWYGRSSRRWSIVKGTLRPMLRHIHRCILQIIQKITRTSYLPTLTVYLVNLSTAGMLPTGLLWPTPNTIALFPRATHILRMRLTLSHPKVLALRRRTQAMSHRFSVRILSDGTHQYRLKREAQTSAPHLKPPARSRYMILTRQPMLLPSRMLSPCLSRQEQVQLLKVYMHLPRALSTRQRQKNHPSLLPQPNLVREALL